jgi:hypothetical protein
MSLDFLDPFMTVARDDLDMNQADGRREAILLADRQQVIQDFLSGGTEEDHVLETLLDQGISPDEYLRLVNENIDYVIEQGIAFSSNESGILLPRHL